MHLRTWAVAAFLVALAAQPASARDWFVRAGASGDGSRENPLGDPFFALDRCEADDTIHVARGVYHGKDGDAYWQVDMPRVTLLGGYDDAFAARDPWKNPTILAFVNEPSRHVEGYLLRGGVDHRGLVVDGLVFDGSGANVYSGEKDERDLLYSDSPRRSLLHVDQTGVRVRNCAFVNSSGPGVDVRAEACAVENCVFVNCVGSAIAVLAPRIGHEDVQPTVIRGNTFLATWSSGGSLDVGADGNAIHTEEAARLEIAENVFVLTDSDAVYLNAPPATVALEKNVFCASGGANVRVTVGGDVSIDDKKMNELGAQGFLRCAGNVVQDPGLKLDLAWATSLLARWAKHAADAAASAASRDAIRQGLGIAPEALGEKAAMSFARPYAASAALGIAVAVPAGAHARTLPPAVFKPAIAPERHAYQAITWIQLRDQGASFEGKRVELVGAFSGERSWYPIPGVTEEEYQGFEFFGSPLPYGDSPALVFTRRGTQLWKKAETYPTWGGSGEPTKLLTIRGVVRTGENGKVGLVLEEIEPRS